VNVALTERAYNDLIRLTDFLLEFDKSAASKAIQLIEDGLQILKQHPFIGRPVQAEQVIEGDLRELVLSQGKTGYVALYSIEDEYQIWILTIRHQREAGIAF
jgi:plasmid stabilization system protein ParE